MLSAQVRRFNEIFDRCSDVGADFSCCGPPSEPLDAKPDFGDLEYAFNEHFASGGIFTPRALGTLMGATYCNPAVLEVVQAFLQLDGTGGAAPASSMHQVLASRWANQTYAKVFERLARDAGAPAIPLGLRRLFNEASRMGHGETVALGEGLPTERRSLLIGASEGLGSDEKLHAPTARYIVTCPEGSELVRPSDVLFVLASPEFVARAEREGHLLTLSNSHTGTNSPMEPTRAWTNSHSFVDY
mmetsp:Transcript_109091/g.292833  ORF Transcript_109091/g.292833 Transcript_109091/m.292833 type:complete len:244 (-) Transcript_109091:100-831(-)